MMAKKRFVLTFPQNLIEQPIIYRLVKDYDLVLNILRAHVTPEEEGKLVLELEGISDRIKDGLNYLKKSGVTVVPLAKDIILNEEECISCGACLAVCATGALSFDKKTYKLVFNRDKCILCERCVPACPLRLIKIKF